MSETIRLDQITVVAVTMAVFAYLGYQRGILRELVAMPGILLAPVVSPWLSAILVPWVNRFYKLAQFARFGGLTSDDLGAVMEQVKKVPPLIQTEQDRAVLALVLFWLVIALGYVLGHFLIKPPAEPLFRWLGAVLGCINGFLLAQVLVPRFWSAQFAVVIVPTGGVMQLLHANTAAVIVVAFIALVAFGLQLAQRK